MPIKGHLEKYLSREFVLKLGLMRECISIAATRWNSNFLMCSGHGGNSVDPIESSFFVFFVFFLEVIMLDLLFESFA
jgi:hypothetical protein